MPSRTRPPTAASVTSPRSTARAAAAATNWRSPARRYILVDDGHSAVSLPEIATSRRAARHRRPHPRWSTSARCAATSPTSSPRWPRACAANARSSGGLVDAIVAALAFQRGGGRARRLAGRRERGPDAPVSRSTRSRPSESETEIRYRHLTLQPQSHPAPGRVDHRGTRKRRGNSGRGGGARRGLLSAAAFSRNRRRAAAPALQLSRDRTGADQIRGRSRPRGRTRPRDVGTAERLVHQRNAPADETRAQRRLDLTAKSLFAVIEPGSCFAGSTVRTRARRRPHLYEVGRRRADRNRSAQWRSAPDEQRAKPSRHAFHRRPGAAPRRSRPATRSTRKRRWRPGW